ncbi:MAG: hypothetical protein FWC79_08200 [Oscillospiraceae bacterium]|nr:hypothetical protein [Oscillospiraceae bacterium]
MPDNTSVNGLTPGPVSGPFIENSRELSVEDRSQIGDELVFGLSGDHFSYHLATRGMSAHQHRIILSNGSVWGREARTSSSSMVMIDRDGYIGQPNNSQIRPVITLRTGFFVSEGTSGRDGTIDSPWKIENTSSTSLNNRELSIVTYHTTENNMANGEVTGEITINGVPIRITREGATFVYRIEQTETPSEDSRLAETFYIRIITSRVGDGRINNTFIVTNTEIGRMVNGDFIPENIDRVEIEHNNASVIISVKDR